MPVAVNGVPLYYARSTPYIVRRNGRDDIVERIKRSDPLAAWPLWLQGGLIPDISGNGFHLAASKATDVTFGVPGIGDGRTAARFNGLSSKIVFPTADINNGGFSGAEGSLLVVHSIPASAWTDGVVRWSFVMLANGNNYIGIHKSSSNNVVFAQRNAGAALKQAGFNTSGQLGYMFSVATWSVDNDALIYYHDSVAKQTVNGLGTFSGPLTAVQCSYGGSGWFKDDMALIALWNRPLLPAEVLGFWRA